MMTTGLPSGIESGNMSGMKRTRFGGLLLVAGLIGAGWLLAKDQPQWLSAQDEQALEAAEPPPPAAGSQAEADDLKAELAAQKNRTPELIAEAKTDDKFSLDLFASAIGPDFIEKNYPATFDLLEGVKGEVGVIVHDSKAHWKRLRPYQAHPEIKALFPARDFSYPSGHSTLSYVEATVLGEIFPDKAAALQERAGQIAESRVVAGVHYPSDIDEGKVLAKAITDALQAKPDFQAAVAAAKAEAQGKAKK